jgi:hypothetical protein
METTIFLAQIWGPVIFAVGLGIFVSRDYYIKIYRDLEKEKFAALVFGMMAIAAGAAHIGVHNTWGTLPEIVISFLGWALFAKGAVLAIAPKFADKAGDWTVKSKMVPSAGGFALLIGVYLSWLGYLV